MSNELRNFLGLVKSETFRSGSVPRIWNLEYRKALSDGLISIGWGGKLGLTDEGDALLSLQEQQP